MFAFFQLISNHLIRLIFQHTFYFQENLILVEAQSEVIQNQYLFDFVHANRFVIHFFHPDFEASFIGFFGLIRSESNYFALLLQVARLLVLKNLFCGFIPVHDGHLQIHYYNSISPVLAVRIGAIALLVKLLEHFECFLAIAGFIYFQSAWGLFYFVLYLLEFHFQAKNFFYVKTLFILLGQGGDVLVLIIIALVILLN